MKNNASIAKYLKKSENRKFQMIL